MVRHIFVISFVLLATSACNKEQSKKGDSGARAEAAVQVPKDSPPNIPAAPTANVANPMPDRDGKTIVKRIAVVREGSKSGIEAEIFRLDEEGKSRYFASTNEQGIAIPELACVATDRFEAKPRIPGYLKVSAKPCRESIDIDLPSAQATYALVVLGTEALAAKDWAKVQGYYALAASKLALSSSAESMYLSGQALVAAGRALGEEEPTQTINNVEVLTPQAINRLKAFQSSKGLNATGILDANTHQELSGLSVIAIERNAQAVPESKVQILQRKSVLMNPDVNSFNKVDSIKELSFDSNKVNVKMNAFKELPFNDGKLKMRELKDFKAFQKTVDQK